jgi:3-phosphoshikimate 1-carboxyvinyltransferase
VVPGLGAGSLQGDAAFASVLERMGCVVEVLDDRTEVRRDGALHGIDIDMAEISDLVPTIAVVAAFADTPTVIRGVGFIRGKESDRIGDLCAELQRTGIDAVPTTDGIVVTPVVPPTARRAGVVLGTHHDHRLAMAFTVLGLGASRLGVEAVDIDDPEVVSKSWPGFWQAFDALEPST